VFHPYSDAPDGACLHDYFADQARRSGAALAVTLIGIPFARAHLKLVPISLWPIGKVIMDRQEVERLRRGG